MKKRSWIYLIVLSLIATSTGIIFNYRITLGFLLGLFFSIILYYQSILHVSMILSKDTVNKLGVFLLFLLNYVLMAVPLIVAIKLNNMFNVFACAIGLSSVKLSIILDSVTERRKDNENHDSV